MHRLLLISCIWLVSCACMSADVLTNGLAITAASAAMQNAGYAKTQLEMTPRDGEDLGFWHVGQGVLIVRYSRIAQKILGMTLWFADERPKALRQEFRLDVTSFDPANGAMSIRTTKSQPCGAANGIQPIRSETNRTSSAAGSRR